MKENRKGFTLIELLAVIVILAVIALIATPIVLNIIANAREASQGRSVEALGSAVINASTELQYKKADISGEFTVTEGTGTSAGTYKVCDKTDATACADVTYSGSLVKGCSITISKGYVAMSGCKVGNGEKTFHYNNSKDTINGIAPTSGSAVADEAKAENNG